MTTGSTEMTALRDASGPRRHPLDSLTADDLIRSRRVLDAAGLLRDSTRFALVQLHEPAKDEVLAWSDGGGLDRQVFSVLLDTASGDVTEAVVSLAGERVLSAVAVPTREWPYGQPGLVIGELETLDGTVRSDGRWQEAMRQRGITDLDRCRILPLSAGQFEFPDEVGHRVMRAITLFQELPSDIPWSRPIEGVIAYVDLIERRVMAFYDYGGDSGPPRQPGLGEGEGGPVRTTLRPLAISQPDGPGFRVDGSAGEGGGWAFRVGFDAPAGLVLNQVGYADDDRVRPIVYRASISEMVVPYADPHGMRFWISYFDEGEYGLGRVATPLTLGCDCLGQIHYFDAVYADDRGEPVALEKVVCMHEEGAGVLWKHHDFFSQTRESRRSRRLVVSFWAAVGNYDYGFFWNFYQDGTIEFEVKLTGIPFAVATRAAGDHATQVTRELAAPFHQHLFNMRLDMTVDGVANTVEEVDVVGVDDAAANPYGNAFTTRTTVIEREADATRVAHAGSSRAWHIVNRTSHNGLSGPVGYKLVPLSNPVLLAQPGSSVAKRAAFATKHLWVTRYDAGQRYAAGPYPNQHAGGGGLPEFQRADRSLVDQDVVVWHTFGSTHLPRTEDWPVMPVERVGFLLKPVNFFDRNPALDLPRSSPGSECSVETDGTCH